VVVEVVRRQLTGAWGQPVHLHWGHAMNFSISSERLHWLQKIVTGQCIETDLRWLIGHLDPILQDVDRELG